MEGLSFHSLDELARWAAQHPDELNQESKDLKIWKALPTSVSNMANFSIWEKPMEIADVGIARRNIHKSMDGAGTQVYNNYLDTYSNLFSLDNSQQRNDIYLNQKIHELLIGISKSIKILGVESIDHSLSLTMFKENDFRSFDRELIKIESAYKALANLSNDSTFLNNEGINFADYFTFYTLDNAKQLLYKYLNYGYHFKQEYLIDTQANIKKQKPIIEQYLHSLGPEKQKILGVTRYTVPLELVGKLRNALIQHGNKYVINTKKASQIVEGHIMHISSHTPKYKATPTIQQQVSHGVKVSKHPTIHKDVDESISRAIPNKSETITTDTLSNVNRTKLEKALHSGDARVFRLNGSDFQNAYISGKIQLHYLKNLNLPKSLSDKLAQASTPQEQRVARQQVANYLKSFHISYIGTPVKNTTNQYSISLTPNNLVLSASQIAKNTSAVHYDNTRSDATSYGTAMHKMAELWSLNLVKRGSVEELQKLYQRGKISMDDIRDLGLVVYDRQIISGSQSYFPKGVFDGISKIKNASSYFKAKYPPERYTAKQIAHEKEYSANISGHWFSATLDSVWEITDKETKETFYEVRDYKSGKEKKGGGRYGLIEADIGATVWAKARGISPDKVRVMTLPLGAQGSNFHPLEGRIFTDKEMVQLYREGKTHTPTKVTPYGLTVKMEDRSYELRLTGRVKDDLALYETIRDLEIDRAQHPSKKKFIRQEKIGEEKFEKVYTYDKTAQKWSVEYKNVLTVGNMSLTEIMRKADKIERELAKTEGIKIAEKVAANFVNECVDAIIKHKPITKAEASGILSTHDLSKADLGLTSSYPRTRAFYSLYKTDEHGNYVYSGKYADLARKKIDPRSLMTPIKDTDFILKGMSTGFWIRTALGLPPTGKTDIKTLRPTKAQIKKAQEIVLQLAENNPNELQRYMVALYKHQVSVPTKIYSTQEEHLLANYTKDYVKARQAWLDMRTQLLKIKRRDRIGSSSDLQKGNIVYLHDDKIPYTITAIYEDKWGLEAYHLERQVGTTIQRTVESKYNISIKPWSYRKIDSSLARKYKRLSADLESKKKILETFPKPTIIKHITKKLNSTIIPDFIDSDITQISAPTDEQWLSNPVAWIDEIYFGDSISGRSSKLKKQIESTQEIEKAASLKRNSVFLNRLSTVYGTKSGTTEQAFSDRVKVGLEAIAKYGPDYYQDVPDSQLVQIYKQNLKSYLKNSSLDAWGKEAGKTLGDLILGGKSMSNVDELTATQYEIYLTTVSEIQRDGSLTADTKKNLLNGIHQAIKVQSGDVLSGGIARLMVDKPQGDKAKQLISRTKNIADLDSVKLYKSMNSLRVGSENFTFSTRAFRDAVIILTRRASKIASKKAMNFDINGNIPKEILLPAIAWAHYSIIDRKPIFLSFRNDSTQMEAILDNIVDTKLLKEYEIDITHLPSITYKDIISSTNKNTRDALKKVKKNIEVSARNDLDILASAIGEVIGDKSIKSWKNLETTITKFTTSSESSKIRKGIIHVEALLKKLPSDLQTSILTMFTKETLTDPTALAFVESIVAGDKDIGTSGSETQMATSIIAEDFEAAQNDIAKARNAASESEATIRGATISIHTLFKALQRRIENIYSVKSILEAAGLSTKAINNILQNNINNQSIIKAKRFFTFDLETGNLSTTGKNPIMQIGLVLDNGKTISYEISPYGNIKEYSEAALAKTGFSIKNNKLYYGGKEVKSSMNIAEGMRAFAERLKAEKFDIHNDALGGYNSAKFDMPVLLNTLSMFATDAAWAKNKDAQKAIKIFEELKLISVSRSGDFAKVSWNPILKSADAYLAINPHSDKKLSFGETVSGHTLTIFQALAKHITDSGIPSLKDEAAILARQEGLNLENFAAEFGLLSRAHNAKYDAKATHQLLKLLHHIHNSSEADMLQYYTDLTQILGMPQSLRGEATRTLIGLMEHPTDRRRETFDKKYGIKSIITREKAEEIVGKTLPAIPGVTQLKEFINKNGGYSQGLIDRIKLIEEGVIDVMGKINPNIYDGIIGWQQINGYTIIEFKDGHRLVGQPNTDIQKIIKSQTIDDSNWKTLNPGAKYQGKLTQADVVELKKAEAAEYRSLLNDESILKAELDAATKTAQKFKLQQQLDSLSARKSILGSRLSKKSNNDYYLGLLGTYEKMTDANGAEIDPNAQAVADLSKIKMPGRAQKVYKEAAKEIINEANLKTFSDNMDKFMSYSRLSQSLDAQAAYLSGQGATALAERYKDLSNIYKNQLRGKAEKAALAPFGALDVQSLPPEQRAAWEQGLINMETQSQQQAAYALQNYQRAAGAATQYTQRAKGFFTPVAMKGVYQDLANVYNLQRQGHIEELRTRMSGLSPAEQAVYNAEIAKSEAERRMQANPWMRAKSYLGNAVSSYMHWQIPMMMVSKVVNKVKELVQLAKQLDQAAVDLQIVTGKSREEVDQLMLSYSDLAKQLGATTKEVAEAANLWIRISYFNLTIVHVLSNQFEKLTH